MTVALGPGTRSPHFPPPYPCARLPKPSREAISSRRQALSPSPNNVLCGGRSSSRPMSGFNMGIPPEKRLTHQNCSARSYLGPRKNGCPPFLQFSCFPYCKGLTCALCGGSSLRRFKTRNRKLHERLFLHIDGHGSGVLAPTISKDTSLPSQREQRSSDVRVTAMRRVVLRSMHTSHGGGFSPPFEQRKRESKQEMMDFSPRSGQERTALVKTMLGKLRRKACVSPKGKFGRRKIFKLRNNLG